MDGTTSTVYLVSIVGPWVTWRNLGPEPTYYGEKIVSGTIVAGHEPWFSAAAEGERCVVEWRRAAASSPFPGRAVRAVLAHADRFEIGDSMYLVYVEPSDAAWTEAPTVAGVNDETSLEILQQLPEDEIVLAARRFLALPHVSAWWYTEFKARTGFVQCRDGRVPRPRACKIAFLDNAVRLRWDVAVWEMFREAWAPGSEHASFERDVGGSSLATLLDCATRLVVLPVE